MTTIAWDGKTLAADRAAWSGSHRYRVRKIFRAKRPNGKFWLVGFSGDGGFAYSVLAWLNGGLKPDHYPEDGNKGTITVALVIDEHRRVSRLDSNLQFTPARGRLHASGGGQECAMGAMLAGATAAQAVRIVARCTDLSAFGVDTLSFTTNSRSRK